MLTDILPSGFHGALTAGVKPGSTVYVAGAGPVGLAAAASAQLLGAAVMMIGDIWSHVADRPAGRGLVALECGVRARFAEAAWPFSLPETPNRNSSV